MKHRYDVECKECGYDVMYLLKTEWHCVKCGSNASPKRRTRRLRYEAPKVAPLFGKVINNGGFIR